MGALPMTRRRDFLMACGALPLGAAAPYMPGCSDNRLAFRILRNDTPIGSHVLDFTARDDGFDVHIAIDIAVKFGPLTLFRYSLTATEQWRGGAVFRVEASTDDDGTRGTMQGQREGDGFWVSGSRAPRYRAPDNAIPANHWNRDEMRVPWINTEDGRLFRPKVVNAGTQAVLQANGTSVTAQHYALSGDVDVDLWYDADGHWVSLAFKGKDGSVVRYERA